MNRSIYIWQRKEWPNFSWDTDALIEPLARVSQMHGTLMGQMSMVGFKDQSNAQVDSMADELISSSQIEGVMLNVNSVRSSIARRLGVETVGLHSEDHYIEGLVDVMLDATQYCREPLSAERIFGWHAALFPMGRSGRYKITVANWRQGEEPMQVVSGAMGHEKVHYEAPPSTEVAKEMEQFINWANASGLSPFIKSALAHLWFVTIHPFDDGNGRISRTLADMMLSRLDSTNARYYSVSAQINRNKKAYYDILERTQKGNLDVTEWLLWIIATVESAIVQATQIVNRTIEKAEYWETHCKKEINERQRKVINKLWDGFDGKLTTSKWAKICHCSQDTALRDINDLITKRMLRPASTGGRSTHYFFP